MRTSLLSCALLVLAVGALAADTSAQQRPDVPRAPHQRPDAPRARAPRPRPDAPRAHAPRGPIVERIIERVKDRAGDRQHVRQQAARELGVTPSQKDLIKDSLVQHRAALSAARTELHTAREALAKTARDGQVAPEALAAAGSRLANATRALSEQRTAARGEAQRILTPQQVQGLEQIRTERKEAATERHAARKQLVEKAHERRGSRQ